MPYVMVPVPEDQVEEVMQFVLRARARASVVPWDADEVREVIEGADEVTRSLLVTVAGASLAGADLTDVEASEAIGATSRETAGLMREVNEVARERNHPSIIATRRDPVADAGEGPQRRLLTMGPEIAELVQSAVGVSGADPAGESSGHAD